MKSLIMGGVLLGAAVLVGPVQAAELDFTKCTFPQLPTVPDGSTASEEEVVAAIGAFKAFQADSQKGRECLDQVKQSAGEEALNADQEKAYTEAYNGSVDAEEAGANQLNATIRAYKAKNPS